MELGDRRTGIRGNRGACLHPMVTRGCVGVAPRGRQVHAPGMTPWPALPPLSAFCRRRYSAWAWRRCTVALTGGVRWQRLRAKLISARVGSARLTCGANVAATAGGADGCAGVSGLLGRLAGPRARALRLAGQRGPSRPSLRGLFLPFFFFYFTFLFHCLNFKFGLEFEFKTEVTYSLEFREFCLIITLWFITLMELLSIT